MKTALLLLSCPVLLALSAPSLLAQHERISGFVGAGHRVMLRGNVHPNVRPEHDLGRVDPSQQIPHIMVLLRPSDSQQTALEQLLEEQQHPLSANYHRWLTPEQFADRFGASRNDLAKVKTWLQAQSFSVDNVARGGNWIAFTGTAEQINAAFQTEMHRYRVEGEEYFANATELSVPSGFGDAVAGFVGLNNFPVKRSASVKKPALGASAQTGIGGGGALAPTDVAAIYDISPLYANGIDGSGQKLTVVGSTGINLSDIRAFRAQFNLPPSDPQLMLFGPDPGTNGDLSEADLDVEWSGAVARGATIVYVYSTDPFKSFLYAVDQNLAPVISMSFGQCEQITSTSIRLFAQEANALGVTVVAASGDSGPADCDPKRTPQATHGLAVDMPGSFPEVTAVGGTQFSEGNGNYWGSVNGATSYIPETAWNETPIYGLWASGGGVSIRFPKPAWQSGPGVPADNFRDVPDIALSAASHHDGYFVYTAGASGVYGGTSVSAPVFAGIVALLNQALIANGSQAYPGLGNINPGLYSLAQSTSGVFHDITAGDNLVPCAPGSTDCSTGFLGYSAGPGYDQATGLGSVDANNLISAWSSSATTNFSTTSFGHATISLFGEPSVLSQNPNADPRCQWLQQLSLEERSGIGIQLTGLWIGDSDFSAYIPDVWGATSLAPFGALQAQICMTLTSVSGRLTYQIEGQDQNGNPAGSSFTVQVSPPLPNPAPLIVSPSSVTLAVAGPSQTATASVQLNFGGAGSLWSASVFPSYRTTSWLNISSNTGVGAAQLTLSASSYQLANGTYQATLVIEADGASPQYVDIPVVFVVGGSGN